MSGRWKRKLENHILRVYLGLKAMNTSKSGKRKHPPNKQLPPPKPLIQHIARKNEYTVTGIPVNTSIEKRIETSGVKTGDLKGMGS